MFNAVIDQVGNLLKQGRVYKISKGIVELSNPKFIIIKHEFCLTLDENSRIIEVDEDDPAIMSVQADEICQFTSLEKIKQMKSFPQTIDFIGVIHRINESKLIKV